MPTKKGEFLTTGGRLRSFLGWAFVISLIIHFLAAPFLKNMSQTSEEQQVEKVAVTKKIKIKVPTPPPPTPTPPPKPQPQQKQQTNPQPQLKLNVQHVQSKSNTGPAAPTYVAPKSGTEQGVPSGTKPNGPPAAGTPGPPATEAPKCATPYQDAHVVQQVTPDYPESARELGLGEVTVAVEVTLSPSGSLLGEKIYSSAGNMSLDQAALSAARQSTYAPKIVNCQPTQGDYLFKVTFDPNS